MERIHARTQKNKLVQTTPPVIGKKNWIVSTISIAVLCILRIPYMRYTIL